MADLRLCPDCGGSGRYRDRCALCQGKGALDWDTGEAVPASDVPLFLETTKERNGNDHHPGA